MWGHPPEHGQPTYPKNTDSLSPSSHQLPIASQLWVWLISPCAICAGGLTMKSAFLLLYSSGMQGMHWGG